MRDYSVGQRVWYEVQTKDRQDFQIPAVVIGSTPRRVLVQFCHWDDGRRVRRLARPHRVAPRTR